MTLRDARVVFVSVALPLAGCAHRARYPYLVTESAPEGYPIEVVDGWVLDARGETITYVPSSTRGRGWGDVGSIHVVGAARKPVPAAVELTWFSYSEDRFYTGTFALPEARLRAAFHRGTPDPDAPRRRLPLDGLIVGMAPGGNVSAWTWSRRVVEEVGTYRASPTEVPWVAIGGEASLSRAAYISMVLAEAPKIDDARAHRQPMGGWDEAARRWEWAPEVKVEGCPEVLWVRMLNGERTWFDLSGSHPDEAPVVAPRALPLDWTLRWRTPAGDRLQQQITLSTADTRAAVDALSSEVGPYRFLVAPYNDGWQVSVTLVRGASAVTLEARDFKVHSLPVSKPATR